MSAQLTFTDIEMEALHSIVIRAIESCDYEELRETLKIASFKLRRGLNRPGRRSKTYRASAK